MEAEGQGARPQEDEVTYFVNRDSQGWVAQTVRRRVYIELKIECTLYRSRDVQKARDDWLCVYCRNGFPSKLRLSDHRVGGCPCGPVDASGRKLELPVYPNLKTAKQGKDLKAALQRGERSFTDVLRDDSMWLELNPELRDVAEPPLERECMSGGSCYKVSNIWQLHMLHGEEVRNRQQGRNGLRYDNLHIRRHQILWI